MPREHKSKEIISQASSQINTLRLWTISLDFQKFYQSITGLTTTDIEGIHANSFKEFKENFLALLTQKEKKLKHVRSVTPTISNIKSETEELLKLANQLTEFNNQVENINKTKQDTIDPAILTVSPLAETVGIMAGKLLITLLNKKTDVKTPQKIAFLTDALKNTQAILRNPYNLAATINLINSNLKVKKITEKQKNWRVFKSRIAMMVAIQCLNLSRFIPLLISPAKRWQHLSNEIHNQKSKEELLDKALDTLSNETLNIIDTKLNIIATQSRQTSTSVANKINESTLELSDTDTKNESDFEEPEKDTDSKRNINEDLELSLNNLKESIAKMDNDIKKDEKCAEKDASIKHEALIFKHVKLVNSMQLKVLPIIKNLYQKANEVAKNFHDDKKSLEALNTLLIHTKIILEDPHKPERSLKKLDDLVNQFKDIKNENWENITSHLKELLQTIRPTTPTSQHKL